MVSIVHENLVRMILDWINNEHHVLDAQIFSDTVGVLGASKPKKIGAYVPDVYCYLPSIRHTIIGDGKTPRDLETRHTRAQLEAYATHLSNLKGSGELVVSTRYHWAACARSILRNLEAVKKKGVLRTTVLCEFGVWG